MANYSLDQNKISKFQNKIFSWWKDNKREFPWRDTNNPYHIMLSEFMLQQTQTTRVEPKFLLFIQKWPTIEDLAKSPKSEIISAWQGLGYNRRAVWLYEACNQLTEYEEFPSEPETLRQFKGIGAYTSRSIPIFAFNANYAAVDTNIRRILIKENFATEDMNKKEIQKIANIIFPRGKSRDWHNALMDYGATVHTTRKTGIKPRTSQSNYRGSRRETRGKVIRYLTELNTSSIPIKTLKDKINSSHNLEHIVNDLQQEGLVVKDGIKISLPD